MASCSLQEITLNLREFSKAIGLSISTVSRALNGYHDVNEVTRQRIFQEAKRLGYTANPAGRRLRMRSSDTIAFVVSPPQIHFANPFFLDVIMGINETLANTPYQLIITRPVRARRNLLRSSGWSSSSGWMP
jgi:LacI family transcriptional regulator